MSFRPFARRDVIMRRPVFVFIRARNPWVRRRFRQRVFEIMKKFSKNAHAM